jgi:hypothetical protein
MADHWVDLAALSGINAEPVGEGTRHWCPMGGFEQEPLDLSQSAGKVRNVLMPFRISGRDGKIPHELFRYRIVMGLEREPSSAVR